jgi:hypothetical protein
MAANISIPKINLRTLAAQVKDLVLRVNEDWDGKPYTDPDAVGTNPTATIYPDGSIVGSTDNGSYTKYPNGDLVCSDAELLASTAITAASGNIFISAVQGGSSFPMLFATLTSQSRFLQSSDNSITWVVNGSAAIVLSQWNPYYLCDSASVTTTGTTIYSTATGRWK